MNKEKFFAKFFVFLLLLSIFLFTHVNSMQDNVTLNYVVGTEFYKKINDSLELMECNGSQEVDLGLTLKIFGNKVSIILRPKTLEEFRDDYIRLLQESIVFPPGKCCNVTAAEKYTKYLIEQYKSNETFVRQKYSKYLNYLKGCLKTMKINNLTYYYILDNDNYVKNYPEMGFFPLYSVKPLYPDVIKKERPVYFNEPITTEGIVLTNIARMDLNFIALELMVNNLNIAPGGPTLHTTLYFKKNYLVYGGDVLLPLNKSTYALFLTIEPTNSTIKFLNSIPDYKLYSENYWFPALIIAAIATGIGVLLWRRK